MALEFLSCLQSALLSTGYDSIFLKVKQVICLESLFLKKDLVAVLPTGYGKSLVFQVLPRLLSERDRRSMSASDESPSGNRSVVLVVSPLNALIFDQIFKLREKGVKAAILNIKEGGEEGDSPTLSWDREGILRAAYDIVFCHPEAFLSCNEGMEVLQSELYRSAVKAVIVDEAHCILEWGDDFRPDYQDLGTLAALFPAVPVAALTATATKKDRLIISSTLSLRKPELVIGNLNRPNITYGKVFREGSDSVSYNNILQPIAEALLQEGTEYPLTLIYLPLHWCGRAYKLFETTLKEKQYVPSTGPHIPENRLFAQFHAPQTVKMKETILKQLCGPGSKCRVVFATMAMGMGVDIPCVRHVVHIGAPRSIREYYQESGRAGRDGQRSWATLFYNNHDIATNKPGMSNEMRVYCKSTGLCLRKQLLDFLDAPPVPGNTTSLRMHDCCDVCKSGCTCADCKENTGSIDQTELTTGVTMPEAKASIGDNDVLMESLEKFVSSLKIESKPVRLRSGVQCISRDILQDIVSQRGEISSVSYLMANFPIFSKRVAEGILKIISQ